MDDLASFFGFNKEELEDLMTYGSKYMLSKRIEKIMIDYNYNTCERFIDRVEKEGIYGLYHWYTSAFKNMNISYELYKKIIYEIYKNGCLCHNKKCHFEALSKNELREVMNE